MDLKFGHKIEDVERVVLEDQTDQQNLKMNGA